MYREDLKLFTKANCWNPFDYIQVAGSTSIGGVDVSIDTNSPMPGANGGSGGGSGGGSPPPPPPGPVAPLASAGGMLSDIARSLGVSVGVATMLIVGLLVWRLK
jgi:hypothetical protein